MAAATTTDFSFSFSFIKDDQERAFLSSAFNAISDCELWHWFKAFESSNSFMFSNCVELDLLRIALDKDSINKYHSGASYAIVLREMEYIAKNGYEKYKSEYVKNKE
jgi:hypothetical protein